MKKEENASNWCRRLRNRKHSAIAILLVTTYIIYIILFGKKRPSYLITAEDIDSIKLTLAVRDRTPLVYRSTVTFLHSGQFDSSVWEDLGTLDILFSMGYRALAVDLPGYGSLSYIKPPKQDFERAVILENILVKLNATETILVVPSMSGSYALPILVRGFLGLKGFVSIASHSVEKYTKVEYSRVKIPTLILYGYDDHEYGELSATHLKSIPNKKVYVMKGAGHACYKYNPEEFHEVLLNFIQEVT